MGTWLNILNKREYNNITGYVVKGDRFQIDSNKAVFMHLESMYNKHVQLTDKLICGGDEIIRGNEIEELITLLVEEKDKLKKIFLDEWKFQRRPKINKTVNGNKYSPDKFDSFKAYLAEKTIGSSEYEIRCGKIGNLKLEVSKEWMKVSKKEIMENIDEYIEILRKAKENNEYIFFSYY